MLTILVVVGIVVLLLNIASILSGFIKWKWFCKLGWHHPDNSSKSFDGCTVHSICRICKRDIMLDSQGNWF